MQGTLHPRRIAAGDIEASYCSDWPIPSATPKLFTAQWSCSGPSSGRALAGRGGEEVWEAALEVTNVRFSLPFAELTVLWEADDTSAQSVERRLFSPRTPPECGAPADRHPLRESVSLGSALDLLPTARPNLPRCHTRSHPKIDFPLHLTVESEHTAVTLALNSLTITNIQENQHHFPGSKGLGRSFNIARRAWRR